MTIRQTTLPVTGSPLPETPVAGTREPAHPADAPLILLTEDNDSTREMTAEFLKEMGYRVREACNGEEALLEATAWPPDLIVMDVQMPGMDGLETIRLIRELPGHRGVIPIIALTALAMTGDRERCLAAGATEYFSKPVRLRALSNCIATLIRQVTVEG